MPTYTLGLDVSHHQGASLDFEAFAREGVQFVFVKATEGASFQDPQFAANAARAAAAGLIVAAYHYLRDNASAAAQVANIVRTVPKSMPVIPDVEANSGGIKLVRDFVTQLQAAGYRVPLTYLPRWYWQQIGSPDLSGLPSLWSSHYPDNVQGSLSSELAKIPASYWNGYGNLGVTVLQYTSSAVVAGRAPLDANAYIGTRDQFAAMLTGASGPKEHNMLILAKKLNSDEIWVGDGLTRRHVADTDELTGLQYWIGQQGGDTEVHENWADLRVLGENITGLAGVTDDESVILTALQKVVAPTVELKPEDVDRFAAAVLATLPDSVREAVRQAFARAGQPETPTS